MKTAIAVFCKTPGLSPFKTRLEKGIGKAYTLEFYNLSIAAIKEVLEEVQYASSDIVVPYWAVAEKEAPSNPLWDSFDCIWTGEGGLGERIHYVLEILLTTFDQVIIIGSDSPQLTPAYLLNAISVLANQSCGCVIGPCEDGGFVLFGSKIKIEKERLTSVEYSSMDTLEQLTRELSKTGIPYTIIQEQSDVDTYDDLKTLRDCFWKMGKSILPGQLALYNWIKRLCLLLT